MSEPAAGRLGSGPLPAPDAHELAPRSRRRILCVSPRYAPSFGTFHYSYPLFGGRIRAFMPPQGLLVIAAYLPESWEVRFVDEKAREAGPDELAWADAIFLSGMHVQRPFIGDVIARAHRLGKPVVLGGPSVSGCPEHCPGADLFQVEFTRQCLRGVQEASFYAHKLRLRPEEVSS